MAKKIKQDNDEPSFFPPKWDKVLKDLPEFKEMADAASPEELKKIIVASEGNIYTIEAEKAADHKLNGAKDLVKEVSAPYRDAAKVQMAKIKYALFLLEQGGQEIGDPETT